MIQDACRTIFEDLGVSCEKIPLEMHQGAHEDQVQYIADKAQVRVRQIQLKGMWYKNAAGPMLAYDEKNDVLVALIRTKKGLEFHSGTKRGWVTKDNSNNFARTAYYFYRPFTKNIRNIRAFWAWAFSLQKQSGRQIALTALLFSAILTIFPILMGIYFDRVVQSGDMKEVTLFCVAILGLLLAQMTFYVATHVGLSTLINQVGIDAQTGLLSRLLELPVPFFRRFSSGELAARVLSVEALQKGIDATAIMNLALGLLCGLNLLVLLYYSVHLTLILLALSTVYAGVVLVAYVGLYQTSKNRAANSLSAVSLEFSAIKGIHKIRVHHAEERFYRQWVAQARGHVEYVGQILRAMGRIEVLNGVSEFVMLAIVFWAIHAGVSRQFTVGELVAFVGASFNFSFAIFRLGNVALQMVPNKKIVDTMAPILSEPTEDDAQNTAVGVIEGHIEIQGVSFHYEEGASQVVRDVSMVVHPGEFVALVGPSGCGKSTLLRILLGFEKPSSGSVLYDGKDLSVLNKLQLRKQLGVVLQQSHLFVGSIFDNIAGSALLSQEEVLLAAKKCGLEDDIKAMPMGLYTTIGEGGSGLSGGQKQRIVIARAIARNPKIIFFDEATSALDNQTQATVTDSLQQLKITRFVIAHRLSTIKKADRIWVMDQGSMVQNGTFDELMQQDGLFKQLASRQLS